MNSINVDPYLEHFRLKREPFGLTPGIGHLYLGRQHGEALAGLQIGIRQRRGLITLIGEVGMGKTTLAHAVIDAMDERVCIGYTAHTTLDFEDMMRPALLGLGLADWVSGKGKMIRGLTELLEVADMRRQIVALIVDEAHNLSSEVFEELRLLLNIESYEAKLLQLVLIGQPELEDRLEQPELRHVNDRIAVRCVLNPLTPKESSEYVDARLEGTGASHDLFTPAALRRILSEARGIPRSINVLCHNALLFAYGEGSERVRPSHARTAIEERRGRQLQRLSRRSSGAWIRRASLIGLGLVLGLLFGLFAYRQLLPSTGNPDSEPTPVEELDSDPFDGPSAPQNEEPPATDGADGDQRADETPAEGAPAAQDPGSDLGLRTLEVETGSSLFELIVAAYGRYDASLLELVLEANPSIEDPNFVVPGQQIVFPNPAAP